MNTNTLKMFILIAQRGSISAAAHELSYAQSNLSTKVQQLEDELAISLFYRTNRGITLTAAGQQLYEQAIKIVALTDKTITDLQHPTETRGQLKIGTLQTAASTFLPTILSRYHQANPAVTLSIQTGTTLASVQRVLNYELDGAIIGGQVNEAGLTVVPLMQEALCLVTANTDQVNVNTSPLLVFPVGCAYRKTLENWLDSQQITIHHPLEFDYLNAIIASVSAGLGISILPQRVVQPSVDAGAVRTQPLPSQFAELPIAFIYRQDYVVSRAFEALVAELKN